ncbi:MAG: protein-L-isoaspartate O-methyltransferase family protein [Alphaproteobacteria bacterium]
MPDYSIARRNMVDSQLRTNKVTDSRLLAAFGELPREAFIDESLHPVAYLDEDIAIAEGRYLLEPMVIARMVQSLAVEPNDVALDIGCGTGFSCALLARLAATVVGLESDQALARQANENLTALSVDNAVVVEGALPEGCAAQAPFNVIFIGGSVAEIPTAITAQLAEGGRVCAVVREGGGRGNATLGLCRNGRVSYRVLFDAASPPLPGFQRQPGFVF